MAKKGGCEICGMPDNSYTIAEGDNVFKVCKLCYDGFVAAHGSDSVDRLDDPPPAEPPAPDNSDDDEGLPSEPVTTDEEEEESTPAEERRKINAALRRAVAAKMQQQMAADTEPLTRELLELKDEIDREQPDEEVEIPTYAQGLFGVGHRHRQVVDMYDEAPDEESEQDEEREMEELEEQELREKQEQEQREKELREKEEQEQREKELREQQEREKQERDREKSQVPATTPPEPQQEYAASALPASVYGDPTPHETGSKEVTPKKGKRKDVTERLRSATNPHIDDERIKITSPEVELQRDERLKTNFDVAVEGHVGAVKFLHAFKFVLHPVTYAIFAGLQALAIATAFFILSTWQRGAITLGAGAVAVTLGAMLMWYLKRRLQVDRRTYLLRIKQEEILFDSMASPCYRELKTKYPMIKAIGWLMSRIAVILPAIVVIGGTIAGVILSFVMKWWLFASVVLSAALAAVILYYMFKLFADMINYKLDIERNQQITEQTLLDILSDRK